MKFHNFKMLLPWLACMAVFVSCNDPENGTNVDENSLAQCLTYGRNVKTYVQNFNKMSFNAQFDNSNGEVTLSIMGMELPDGNPIGIKLPLMEIQGLRWKYNSQGWKIINANDVTPVITGMGVLPVFSEINFAVADVFDMYGNYCPGIQYRMKLTYLNNEYELVGCCMSGTTDVTLPDGGAFSPESDTTVKNKPVYWVDLDFEAKTVDLYLYNAKFLGAMPSLNLMFPDIPYSINDGKIVLK